MRIKTSKKDPPAIAQADLWGAGSGHVDHAALHMDHIDIEELVLEFHSEHWFILFPADCKGILRR